MSEVFISILMLTHNAPEYVEISVRSVAKHTSNIHYELIVLDNASRLPTQKLVKQLKEEGLIHKLVQLDRNSLFAEGNNLAASEAAPEATHYLLLNSDIQVRSGDWLQRLLDVHQRGITAYGVAQDPDRVDGYCLLIDADVYKSHKLDEGHQWWWAVTKMQASVLNAGFHVQGYAEHAEHLHHFGGKSGSAFRIARGMNVTPEQVYAWFDGKKPRVIDRRTDGAPRGHEPEKAKPLLRHAADRLKRLFSD